MRAARAVLSRVALGYWALLTLVRTLKPKLSGGGGLPIRLPRGFRPSHGAAQARLDCPVPLWVLWLGLERRRCDTIEPITHCGMVAHSARCGWRERVLRAWPSAKDALLASG